MSQSGKPESSLVVGVVASLLLAALLISTVVSSSLAGWVWIVALTVSAGLFGGTYLLNRQPWAALGAYAGAAIALFVFLVDKADFPRGIVPALAILGVAAPFYIVWRADRRQMFPLAVAYILVAAIPIPLIEAATDYEEVLVTLYVLLAIGVGLIGGYRMSRSPARQ